MQALLEVNIGGAKLDQVVLLSAKRLTEAILGLYFLINYEAEISSPERRTELMKRYSTSKSQARKKNRLIVSANRN